MATPLWRRFGWLWMVHVLIAAAAQLAHADEIWVAPTAQADLGGLEIASNTFWPVTPMGAVRMAWAVPNNLQTFQGARVVVIPSSPGGAASMNVYVCAAQNGNSAAAGCAGPFAQPFTGVPNQLVEVEIGPAIASRIGTPGASYLTVLAYTGPTTSSDHILGLRFAYVPAPPGGVAGLGKNTFTGPQTAPAFIGDGSGLTNLPAPSGVATLGANTFRGTQTAPAFVGNGEGLTNIAKLTANTFTATQKIDDGNLDLDLSTASAGNITKNGQPFLHDWLNRSTFLGRLAGNFTMGGDFNTGIGQESLAANTEGFANVGLGSRTLAANTTGNWNTAAGEAALLRNTTGMLNTAIGEAALFFNTTGSQSTAVGAQALQNSTGVANTAVGYGALPYLTSGNSNIGIGGAAGYNVTTGSSNIYLGNNLPGAANESNTMRLGVPFDQTRTFIAGIRGVATGVANAVPVVIDSDGQLGTASSSRRFKEDIHDMADASRPLFQLRPVTFRYTQAYANGTKPIQFGLIAEEVAEVFPELAVRDMNGEVETVHYETLNVLLLNEVQKQQHELELERAMRLDQQQRIEVLEQRLHDLLSRREGPAHPTIK